MRFGGARPSGDSVGWPRRVGGLGLAGGAALLAVSCAGFGGGGPSACRSDPGEIAMGFVNRLKESPGFARDTLLGGMAADSFNLRVTAVTDEDLCARVAAAYRQVLQEETGRRTPPRPVIVHEADRFFIVADPAERTSLRDPRGPDRVITMFFTRDLRHLATTAVGGGGQR